MSPVGQIVSTLSRIAAARVHQIANEVLCVRFDCRTAAAAADLSRPKTCQEEWTGTGVIGPGMRYAN